MRIRVRIEDKSKDFIQKVRKIMVEEVYRAEARAVRYAPSVTGHLRQSINVEKITENHYRINDGVDYGIYVEYGTMPHIITPKQAQALRFELGEISFGFGNMKYGGGKVVYAKRVNHPGSSQHPFMRPAFYVMESRIRSRLWKEVLHG